MSDKDHLNSAWEKMVESGQPLTLSASHMDQILASIFNLQSAVYQTIASINYIRANNQELRDESIELALVAANDSLANLKDFPQKLITPEQ